MTYFGRHVLIRAGLWLLGLTGTGQFLVLWLELERSPRMIVPTIVALGLSVGVLWLFIRSARRRV